MDAHESAVPLREALLFLAVAGLLIPLLQRARFNPVFGFLMAGALLGPHGLGGLVEHVPLLHYASFPDRAAVEAPAQLGLLFLMFSIGLELSLERLWGLRRWVFGAGGAQLLLCAAAIGGVLLAMGTAPGAATVVGFALAFSSTAVALQLLAERDRLGTPLGRASFAVLLMQDLAVVPLLLLVGVLASGGEGMVAGVTWALVKGALAIVVLYALGKRLIQPAFRRLIVPGRPDTFVALTLLASLGIAAATGAVGMSPALGALLAGLLLSETEFRHEIEATLEPFKGLLMGMFFLSVGMSLDAGALWREPLTIIAGVVGLFALKAALTAAVLRVAGLPWARSVEAGLLLGQGGEFGFVMLGAATAAQVLDEGLARTVTLVIGLSLFATPAVAALARRIGERLERTAARPEAAQAAATAADTAALAGTGDDGPPVAGRVVLAGYGTVGRLVGEVLDAQRIDWMALETNPRAIVPHHEAGRPVVFGDATRPGLLRRLGIADAAVLVVTLPRLSTALAVIEVARREAPALRILARARNEREARRLREAGADAVIPETLECGLRLAQGALEVALALPVERIGSIVDAERERRIMPLRD